MAQINKIQKKPKPKIPLQSFLAHASFFIGYSNSYQSPSTWMT